MKTEYLVSRGIAWHEETKSLGDTVLFVRKIVNGKEEKNAVAKFPDTPQGQIDAEAKIVELQQDDKILDFWSALPPEQKRAYRQTYNANDVLFNTFATVAHYAFSLRRME